MGFIELFILAIGLSMDAFAVSICKGLSLKKTDLKSMAKCGFWFGGFQALMPFLGYFLGKFFASFANRFMPWIGLILLTLIGVNMIREAFEKEEEACDVDARSLGFKPMLIMAIATSIDAFAVGITFETVFSGIAEVLVAVAVIGVVTFWFSYVGMFIGNRFGQKHKKLAEIAGGSILIMLGIYNFFA